MTLEDLVRRIHTECYVTFKTIVDIKLTISEINPLAPAKLVNVREAIAEDCIAMAILVVKNITHRCDSIVKCRYAPIFFLFLRGFSRRPARFPHPPYMAVRRIPTQGNQNYQKMQIRRNVGVPTAVGAGSKSGHD